MFASCGEYHQKLSELAEKERLALEKKQQEQAEKDLLDACKNGNVDKVKELLAKKVNIDCCYESYVDYSKPGTATWKQDYLGDPIYLAIKNNYPDILRMLLESAVPLIKEKIKLALFPTLTDEQIQSQLVNIIDNQNRNSVCPLKHFYYLSADPYTTSLGFISERHQPLLIEAILLKSKKCVDILVNQFNAHPMTPFYKVRKDSYKQCSDAIKVAANIDSKLTLFLLQHEKFKSFFSDDQNRIEYLNSLLLPAVKSGDENVVTYLLTQGIDIHDTYIIDLNGDKKYAIDLAKGAIKSLLIDYDRAVYQQSKHVLSHF